MAKGNTNKENPTFEKQMDNYIKDNIDGDDPIFSHAYNAYFVNLLKKRDDAVKFELIEAVRTVNKEFREQMYKDVTEIIREQWANALNDSLKEWEKTRDKKILSWLILTVILSVILSISLGLLINIWYHNHYLLTPILSKMSLLFR